VADPSIVDMTESEFTARFGVDPQTFINQQQRQQLPPLAPDNQGTAAQPNAQGMVQPVIIDMPESEFRARYGSMAENALQGIKDIPSNLYNMVPSLVDTAKQSAGAGLSLATGQEAMPAEKQGLRNLGSLAAGTSGAMLGLEASAPFWAAGPIAGGAASIALPAIGGAAGLLGLDWFAEKMGVDAPRTTQERLNSLAYNTAGGIGTDLALRGIGAGARAAAAPVKAIATEGGRTQAAANVLRDVYGPNAIGRIEEAAKALEGDPLGGYRSTAELLQSQPASQLQKIVQSTQIVDDPIGQQMTAREAARRQLLDEQASPNARIDDVQRSVSDSIDSLREASAAADAQLPANIDPSVAGGGLREIAERLAGKAREGVQQEFSAIPDSEVKRFTPDANLKTAVGRLADYFGPGSEGAPSQIRKMVETLAPDQKQQPKLTGTDRLLAEISDNQQPPQSPLVDLDYLQRLRRWAGEEATQYFNKGENRAGSVAQAVVNDIDTGLEQAVKDGTMPQEQATAYKNALKAHKQMMDTFDLGPTGRILRRGQGSTGYQLEPSSVGRQFWNSNREALQNYGKALGGNLEANELLVRDAVSDFRKTSVNIDGSLNPEKVKKWMNAHADLLNVFPEIKNPISTIYETEARAKLRDKNFGKFVEADPEQAAGVLMSGSQSLQRLRSLKQLFKSNPEKLEGLRRGTIDRLTRDLYNIGGQEAKPATFKRFVQNNESYLNELFTPDQMRVFDSIYKDLSSQVATNDLATQASRGQSATQQKLTNLDELKSQISQEFGVAGKLLSSAPKVGGAIGAGVSGAVGFGKGGTLGGSAGLGLGAGAGLWVGNKVALISKRAENAALAQIAKAAADPQFAQLLLTKASPRRLSMAKEILDKKNFGFSAIRQLLVTGALLTRTDTAKAAQSLATLLEPSSYMVSQPSAQPQLEDLASALTQNPSAPVGEASNPLRMEEEKAPMSDEKPSKITAPVGNISLEFPRQVDARLVDAVAHIESGNRADAVGPLTKYGQAKGRMQLLDSTGKEVFKKLGLSGKYDPFDREQNTQIGTAYLSDLVDRYQGSVPLGLAAYNWGMGNLDRAIAKLGQSGPLRIQQFLEQETIDNIRAGMTQGGAKRAAAAALIEKFGPSVISDYLPAETQNYVKKIIARYNGSPARRGGVVEA